MSKKAIFLDKDGTLIPDIPYNIDPDKITLSEGAAEGLGLLYNYGFEIFIVSNQPGVAHGYFEEGALLNVEKKIADLLRKNHIRITGFYYCPHHPMGKVAPYNQICRCRKPRPGLILSAANQHNIDLKRSWMIGDILHDVEAGRKAGCRTVLIDNGNETEWEIGEDRVPDFMLKDIRTAAAAIIKHHAVTL